MNVYILDVLFTYVFVFGICAIAACGNRYLSLRSKHLIEICLLLVLCVISGTRYNLGGTDYYLYKTVYDGLPGVVEFFKYIDVIRERYQTFGWEKGYLLLNSLAKSLGLSFYGFTLLHAFFFYFCLYVGLRRYTENFSLLLVVFLYKLFFYETFIAMRQSITIALFFISLKHIENRNVVRYYFIALVALFIHRGAFILFFLYYILNLKLTYSRFIWLNVIFIPTLLISFLSYPILNKFGFLLSYITDSSTLMRAGNILESETHISIFHTLEYFLLMLLVGVNYRNIENVDRHASFIVKIFLLLLPFFTILRGYGVFTREKDYFVVVYGVLLSYLLLIKKCRYRQLVLLGTISICAFGFIRFVFSFDQGAMIPYVSWLFVPNAHFLKY